jgi:cytochrome b
METKVWDPLVRTFHWALAIAFTLAYLIGDEVMGVHVVAGYTIAGLIAFRLVWGMIGPQHARFSDFVCRPRGVIAYLKDLMHGRAARYRGHNPAGGAMIIALLTLLVFTVASGVAVYGADEQAGPLAGTMAAYAGSEWVEEVHEFFANATMVLVVFHNAGVVISSLLHGENLPLAMVTGRKRV